MRISDWSSDVCSSDLALTRPMGVAAHYLEIEWDSPGVARRIEVSTYPIEIDTAGDGALHAEVSIFRNFAPWVGLQLSGDLASVEPTTVDAKAERHQIGRTSCRETWVQYV